MAQCNRSVPLCLVLTAVCPIWATTGQPTVHTVDVGKGGNSAFDPNITFAAQGDVVVFRFFPTNHSVVRGEYTESTACGSGGCNPCIPYEIIHSDKEGFNSGNILTQEFPVDGRDPSFNITIQSTSSVWYYCAALVSCHPNGMVGVINPAKGTSLEKQRQAAINAPFQLSPGQPWPAEGSSDSGLTSASSPIVSSAAVNDHRISSGVVAGITIGVLLVVFLATGLFYFIARSRKSKDKKDASFTNQPSVNVGGKMELNSAANQYSDEPLGAGASLQLSSPVSEPHEEPLPAGDNIPFSPVMQQPSITSTGYIVGEKQPLSPTDAHPAFGPNSIQSTAIELPGDIPRHGT